MVENLLTRMLTNDTYSISQLEEAIAWFQAERRTVSGPMEGTLTRSISEELYRLIRQQNQS